MGSMEWMENDKLTISAIFHFKKPHLPIATRYYQMSPLICKPPNDYTHII